MAKRPDTVEAAVTELMRIRESFPKVWAVMLKANFYHYFKHTSFTDEQKAETIDALDVEAKPVLATMEKPDPPKKPLTTDE